MFIDVATFGAQADACAKYLTKGRAVAVTGRLVYREWDDNGTRRSRHHIVGRVQFGGRTDNGDQPTNDDQPAGGRRLTTTPPPERRPRPALHNATRITTCHHAHDNQPTQPTRRPERRRSIARSTTAGGWPTTTRSAHAADPPCSCSGTAGAEPAGAAPTTSGHSTPTQPNSNAPNSKQRSADHSAAAT